MGPGFCLLAASPLRETTVAGLGSVGEGVSPTLDAWLMLSEPSRRRKLETQRLSNQLRDLELPQYYRLATSSADFGERPSSVNSPGVKISIKGTHV